MKAGRLHVVFLRVIPVAVVGLVTAIAPSASGHGHAVPWVQPGAVDDNGVYATIEGPTRIRKMGPVTYVVTVLNLQGTRDYTLRNLQLYDGTGNPIAASSPNAVLKTQAAPFEQFRQMLGDRHPKAVTQPEQMLLADQIAEHAFRWRVRIDETRLGELLADTDVADLRVTIALAAGSDKRELERRLAVHHYPPLPNGRGPASVWRLDPQTGKLAARPNRAGDGGSSAEAWYAGDQHVHSTFSVDTHFPVSGSEPFTVTEFGEAGRALGLTWIVITDHSNVHGLWPPIFGEEYYTPGQHTAGTIEAINFTVAHADFTLMYSQEMGVDTADPKNESPAHLLVYPYAAFTTGFIPNPSSGGLLYNYNNCEDAQVILDRVNTAGGLGFIAHPFSGAEFLQFAYDRWDDWDATGFAGLEIWSDSGGQIKETDVQSQDHWQTLLAAIAAPQGGELLVRPDFPTRFPVGLGNSDAHTTANLGQTFTYIWWASPWIPSQPGISTALVNGHCVASNGPLVFATLEEARIGEVARIGRFPGDLIIDVRSTPEFGPDLRDYVVKVFIDGVQFGPAISLAGVFELTATIEVPLDLTESEKYVHVRLDRNDGSYHAIANPIWLEFTCGLPGDFNCDGDVDLFDYGAFLACFTGPDGGLLPLCEVMDFDGDEDVDLHDAAGFQVAFTGP